MCSCYLGTPDKLDETRAGEHVPIFVESKMDNWICKSVFAIEFEHVARRGNVLRAIARCFSLFHEMSKKTEFISKEETLADTTVD